MNTNEETGSKFADVKKTQDHRQQLQHYLIDILPQYPDGISEYDLLLVLKKPPYTFYNDDLMSDPLMTFQTHFMLFNALYELREQWLASHWANLEIRYSNIKMHHWTAGQAGLQPQDKLREYYLDWNNFTNTDQQQVEKLLDNFWKKLGGLPLNDAGTGFSIVDARKILEVQEQHSQAELKQQYRRLLHQHHPDKGGETAYTQKLHQAYQQLKYHCS